MGNIATTPNDFIDWWNRHAAKPLPPRAVVNLPRALKIANAKAAQVAERKKQAIHK